MLLSKLGTKLIPIPIKTPLQNTNKTREIEHAIKIIEVWELLVLKKEAER